MEIGICGNCGGTVDTNMEGIGYCRRCGARVKNSYRVLPMEKPSIAPRESLTPCDGSIRGSSSATVD
jgi:DNA-directed RNA polymerase subunit RPC12/RpoP